jgi:hypothetical protein
MGRAGKLIRNMSPSLLTDFSLIPFFGLNDGGTTARPVWKHWWPARLLMKA